MKIHGISALMAVFICLAQAQERAALDPGRFTVLNPAAALRARPKSTFARQAIAFDSTPQLPVWQYQFVSPRDGNTYAGSMVGGNPFNRGARTTTIPIVLVPVRVEFTGTSRNFDPTSADDGCLGSGNTAISLIQASPMFQNASFTINGVSMGSTTYPDAVQRAMFWPAISGVSPAYHTAFSISVAATQTIAVEDGTSNGQTVSISGDCSTNSASQDNPPYFGVLDLYFVDPLLQTMITNLGINPNQFPLFVLYGVAMTVEESCCVLGYHNVVSVNATPANPGQTYGIAEYDQGYIFGLRKDVTVMSHEIQEWIDDPSTVNLTPAWGNIGQVSGCQNNLEVGDPLSGAQMPPVTMSNGVTYHLQELAFMGWFLGTPFAGAGGKYSSHGTFGGSAKACPPGGTN